MSQIKATELQSQELPEPLPAVCTPLQLMGIIEVTVQVWGRPPVGRFTESLTPCPPGRRNTGPEVRLTGRPEAQSR
ncbi:MAG: hypothetical protein WCK27_23935, partial [Verrucomicrobiota bacterium]